MFFSAVVFSVQFETCVSVVWFIINYEYEYECEKLVEGIWSRERCACTVQTMAVDFDVFWPPKVVTATPLLPSIDQAPAQSYLCTVWRVAVDSNLFACCSVAINHFWTLESRRRRHCGYASWCNVGVLAGTARGMIVIVSYYWQWPISSTTFSYGTCLWHGRTPK